MCSKTIVAFKFTALPSCCVVDVENKEIDEESDDSVLASYAKAFFHLIFHLKAASSVSQKYQ
jgi:hypothetical protein